ncbi:MAG TPA: methionine adenosyltransferase [Candidatus Bilamarchaeum sp.]|nr:methionine adenosyltransferase [Candidatus Bilamarchaeum sp.]
MRNIVIERGTYLPVGEREVELAERKGIGHPDSLIDGIMEEISRGLSRAYLDEFGKILHHNVDKGQICGGATKVEFGGGVFTKPIFILLSGRATAEANGKKIPIHHIANSMAHKYLESAVPQLDVCNDVQMESRISAGSSDLVELFLRGPKVPFANDTSFGTGFAPLSDLENLVLSTEKYLNSAEYKARHPEVGTDIKVMGLREKSQMRLTIACAFISKHIPDVRTYSERKARLREDVQTLVGKLTDKSVEVSVNTADDEKSGSVYITLTGTSAEMGDDGSVGRGNRVNGLITPMRSMTLEAAAGKNPVNHVGKIYSVLATDMASSIAKENPHIRDITITLLSQIGRPIDQPKVASVSIISDGSDFGALQREVAREIDSRLERVTEVTERIVSGKVPLF